MIVKPIRVFSETTLHDKSVEVTFEFECGKYTFDLRGKQWAFGLRKRFVFEDEVLISTNHYGDYWEECRSEDLTNCYAEWKSGNSLGS